MHITLQKVPTSAWSRASCSSITFTCSCSSPTIPPFTPSSSSCCSNCAIRTCNSTIIVSASPFDLSATTALSWVVSSCKGREGKRKGKEENPLTVPQTWTFSVDSLLHYMKPHGINITLPTVDKSQVHLRNSACRRKKSNLVSSTHKNKTLKTGSHRKDLSQVYT